jgi:predicted transcriptional regulator
MNVLLSIKPEFVNKIFNGQKKYEYRRAIFKREDINKIVVYATAPISKVVGEFEIENILFEDVSELWEKTKIDSGVKEQFFYHYFNEKDKGYAIKIKNFLQYSTPQNLNETYGVMPPQSFLYIDDILQKV